MSLSYRYRRFSTRLLFNCTGGYLDSFSATSPARNERKRSRKIVNVGLYYE